MYSITGHVSFVIDNIIFSDIDECSNGGGPCQNGKCVNTAGSYRCECQDGFNLGLDGRTCLGRRRIYRLIIRFYFEFNDFPRQPSRSVLRQLSARVVFAAFKCADDEIQLLLFVRHSRSNARMGFIVLEMSFSG